MMFKLSFYTMLFIVCLLFDQVDSSVVSCAGCLAAAGIVCAGGILAGPACAWATQSCIAVCAAPIP